MTARTFMITAGALFVLAAPAAQASLDRMNTGKAPLVKHHKVALKHHSTPKAKTGGKASRTTPLYIYFPGTGAASTPSVNDCATTGNDCTDQELCDIWGMNCDMVVSTPTTAASPAELASVDVLQSDAQSTEAPPVEVAASDNSSASDTSIDSSDEDC